MKLDSIKLIQEHYLSRKRKQGVMYCMHLKRQKFIQKSGASPGFGRGGPRIFFFRFGNLHVANRHAAHGEAMRFARGVRGPPRNFF